MDLLSGLIARFPRTAWERDFSFARHTTIGCGGRAALAAAPASAEECASLLSLLGREKIPAVFLGAGANVLPPDCFFEGVVLRFTGFSLLRAEGTRLFAGAGVTGGALCRFARTHGLSGFEPFTGIPMTVGGGVTMNAGVRGGHFSDVVETVVGIEGGKLRTFSCRACAFGEKESIFQSGIAVIGAYLKGTPMDCDEIGKRTETFRAARRALPKGRSMGCVFVNPKNRSAGKLIDECGLKGLRIGGARVSELHANFILNEGGTASDVAALIDEVKRLVEERSGIRLREEIRRL